MLKKLSKEFKVDINLISDFIEKETTVLNDESSFNKKFK